MALQVTLPPGVTAVTAASPSVAHTLPPGNEPNLPPRARQPMPNASGREFQFGLLICIGTVGIVGNIGIMGAIVSVRYLRKSASAFMFHHCVLDLLKSLYCIIFANSILANKQPMYCNLLGGSFIVCVTSTAFNMLAMVMNEAYVFADLNAGIRDSGNYCCVVFSISTIWFASIILNLGVAFLPGNPSFIPDIGHCTFVYGATRNYVLHVLWIILVTFAVALTAMYLRKLYADIRNSQYTRLAKVVRASISIDPGQPLDDPVDDLAERAILKKVERYSLRKMYTLLFMTTLFIMFWYPLFMLTVVDPNFGAPPVAYKALTIFACSNAAVNPFIFTCLIKKKCCCRYDLPALPLTVGDKSSSAEEDILQSSNRYSRYLASDDAASGIYNEFFRPPAVDEQPGPCSSIQLGPPPPCDLRRVSIHSVRGLWSQTGAITSTL